MSVVTGRTAEFNAPIPHIAHIIGAVSSNREERKVVV
jgi:hypothetical protein